MLLLLITALLLNRLTGTPHETNFNEKGFLKDVTFLDREISKKYQVNDQSYNLSIVREI